MLWLFCRTMVKTEMKGPFSVWARTALSNRSPTATSSVISRLSSETDHKGRMFSVQASLPHLPVPALQQTLDRYLLSVKPIVSGEEFNYTEQVVKQFGERGGQGEKLQNLLEQKASKSVNWLYDWWLDVAYLAFRLPVVVHSSPGIVLPVQDFHDQEGQLKFAAKLISGILDFKDIIDEKSLPVESLGGKPLCMSQYFKILSTCRIPGRKHDASVTFPSDGPNPPRHIVIAHNNNFFSLEVYGRTGQPLTETQLLKQLFRIVEQSQTKAPPIGIMTTQGRNAWGKVYEQLLKDPTNKASLEELHRAIFMICLDQPLPHSKPEERYNLVAAQMLHGVGSQWNSGNRWFDKTLQFIVGDDGNCGLNYEHSMAEGPPIAALIDHAVEYCARKTSERSVSPPTKSSDPRKLKFNLSNEILGDLETACQRMDELVSDVQFSAFKFQDFGKNFVKSCKLSPDAFIQIAVQNAYFSAHKEPPATYESGSTRMFQLGRTETIRSCSIASDAFARAMQDPSVSNEVKVDLLRKAIQSHRAYTTAACSGQGVDRHLLGLKLIAVENGLNVPELFMDTTYSASTHHKLSTSQVSAKSEAVLCFGPTAPDGYGLCYNPQPDQFIFSITAFNSSPETDTAKLEGALRKSLSDIRDLLLVTGKSKL